MKSIYTNQNMKSKQYVATYFKPEYTVIAVFIYIYIIYMIINIYNIAVYL